MGRSFYTYDEAARRLQKSKRTVLNYIKKGLLRAVPQDGTRMIDKEDVETLAIDLGADYPVLNRVSVFRMMARLEKLENEMRTVTHILELKDDPLRPDPVAAKGFHAAACEALVRTANREWTIEEVRLWAGQLEKMDEETLEAFCVAMGDNKAWSPFFRLCREMETYASRQTVAAADHKVYLEWYQLEKQLANGRRKLRAAIVLFIEMGKGASTERLLDLIDDPGASVIHKLGS